MASVLFPGTVVTAADKVRLKNILLQHEPSKATDESLDKVLQKYGGSEESMGKLWSGMVKKYGPEISPPSDDPSQGDAKDGKLRSRSKSHRRVADTPDDLLYPKEKKSIVTVADKARLVRYYEKYDPSKANDNDALDVALKRFGTSEASMAKMWAGLEKKYGPEPPYEVVSRQLSSVGGGEWTDRNPSVESSAKGHPYTSQPVGLVSKAELRSRFISEFGIDDRRTVSVPSSELGNASPNTEAGDKKAKSRKKVPSFVPDPIQEPKEDLSSKRDDMTNTQYSDTDLLFPGNEDCVATHNDKRRLARFYAHYCGDRKAEADVYATLHRYGGSRMLLSRFWAGMVAKYGPEPDPEMWGGNHNNVVGRPVTGPPGDGVPNFEEEQQLPATTAQSDLPTVGGVTLPQQPDTYFKTDAEELAYRQDYLRLVKYFSRYCEKKHRRGPEEIAVVLQRYHDTGKVKAMWTVIGKRFGEVPSKVRKMKTSEDELKALTLPKIRRWDGISLVAPDTILDTDAGFNSEDDYFYLFEHQRSDPTRPFGVPGVMSDVSSRRSDGKGVMVEQRPDGAPPYSPEQALERYRNEPPRTVTPPQSSVTRGPTFGGSVRIIDTTAVLRGDFDDDIDTGPSHLSAANMVTTPTTFDDGALIYELTLRLFGGDYGFYANAPSDRARANFRSSIGRDICDNLNIKASSVEIRNVYEGSIMIDLALKFPCKSTSSDSSRQLAESAARVLLESLSKVVVTGRFKTSNLYRSYHDDLLGNPTHNPLVHSVIIDPVSALGRSRAHPPPSHQPDRQYQGSLEGGVYRGGGYPQRSRITSTFDPAQAMIEESLGAGTVQTHGRRIAAMRDCTAQLRTFSDPTTPSTPPTYYRAEVDHLINTPNQKSKILSPFDVTRAVPPPPTPVHHPYYSPLETRYDTTRTSNTTTPPPQRLNVSQPSQPPVTSPPSDRRQVGTPHYYEESRRSVDGVPPATNRPRAYPLELLGTIFSSTDRAISHKGVPYQPTTTNIPDDRHFSPFLTNLWQNEHTPASKPQHPVDTRRSGLDGGEDGYSSPSWRGGSVASVTDARTGAQRTVYDARTPSVEGTPPPVPTTASLSDRGAPAGASTGPCRVGSSFNNTISDVHHQRRAQEAAAKGRRVFVAGAGGAIQGIN